MVNRLKFLHIADLHLGRLLYGRSLIEDQRHFLFENLLPAIDGTSRTRADRRRPLRPAGRLHRAIALFDALLVTRFGGLFVL